MLVYRSIRFDPQALLGVCRILLLPLLLLFAQQGVLLHEMNHSAAYDTDTRHQSEKQEQDSHGEFCELCLAFAQVGSAAASGAGVPELLADLAFDHALPGPDHGGTTELTTPRSRGPPITF